MIATLRKYPWFATDLFTVQERDLLFDTTLSLVCTLANNLRRPDCHKLLTPTLLQELVHAGLDAPGFSESQRARVLAAAGGPNTIPNAAPPHPLALNCPLRVLTLHGADTLTSFYLHCIKRAANHLVITASKGNISDAVQKSANSPSGASTCPGLPAVRTSSLLLRRLNTNATTSLAYSSTTLTRSLLAAATTPSTIPSPTSKEPEAHVASQQSLEESGLGSSAHTSVLSHTTWKDHKFGYHQLFLGQNKFCIRTPFFFLDRQFLEVEVLIGSGDQDGYR